MGNNITNEKTSVGMNAPEIIRVKRKREDDSVQALLLEEQRNNKRGKFVFKLAKTIELSSNLGEEEPNTPLLKQSIDGDEKHFILEQQRQRKEVDQLPAEIAEMLDDYLSLDKKTPSITAAVPLRKVSRKHSLPTGQTMPAVDYVYDIYYREMVPENEFVFDKNTVGYIKIIEDNGDLIPEEDEDIHSQRLSDDEDSNDETYYQNDYPEDEDDDRSVLFSSEHEEVITHEDSMEEENVQSFSNTPILDEGSMLAETELDPLFERYSGATNVLDSVGNYEPEDDDYGDDMIVEQNEIDRSGDDDVHFERQNFFPSDRDDALAIHRDRIFNELQEMINRS